MGVGRTSTGGRHRGLSSTHPEFGSASAAEMFARINARAITEHLAMYRSSVIAPPLLSEDCVPPVRKKLGGVDHECCTYSERLRHGIFWGRAHAFRTSSTRGLDAVELTDIGSREPVRARG
jgi:hypothetical protein